MPVGTDIELKLKLDVVTTVRDIQKAILKECAQALTKLMTQSIPGIRLELSRLIERSIKASPEYASLIGGELHAHLGLIDPVGAMDDIIITLAKNMIIYNTPVRVFANGFAGGIVINMIKDDYSDIIASPAATYISNKKYEITWLEWLLLEGSEPIIMGWDVNFHPRDLYFSRSGKAIMLAGIGSEWGVPGDFSGTIHDNFITRSTPHDYMKREIKQILEKVFNAII